MLSAVILCGGKGTRMGSLTEKTPKSLLKVNNKPILWYIIAGLYSGGVRHFLFPTGYGAKSIEKYITKLKTKDAVFSCIYTGIDDTIGSRIKQLKPHIKSEDFLIVNGDCIADFDLNNLTKIHLKNKNLVTIMSCTITSPYGLIQSSGSRVTSFLKEQRISHLSFNDVSGKKRGFSIYSGFGCINKNALQLIDLDKTFEFEIDLFNAAAKLKKIGYLKHTGFWFALETPKDLEIINANPPSKLGYKDFTFK